MDAQERELRHQRAELIAEAGKILKQAGKDRRDLTAAEDEKWTQLHADAEQLRRKYEAPQKRAHQDALEAELRRPLGNSPTPAMLGWSYGSNDPGSAGRGDFGQVRALNRSDSVAQAIAAEGAADPTLSDIRPGALLRAMMLGPKTDAEKRALSVGTDSAGGYTVPDIVAGNFIDNLRARSSCIQAGATTMLLTDGKYDVARITADPTVAWIAENGSISDSDPTFDAVQFRPKIMVALVKVSRALVEDSVNIERALEAAFAGSLAAELDKQALEGDGGSNNPTGVSDTTNVNSVSMGTDGAAPTDYGDIVDCWYQNALDNAQEPTAIICHPRTTAAYAKLATGISGDATPLAKPALIANLPWFQSTGVSIARTQGSSNDASNLYLGYWPDLLIGIRSQLRVEVLKETFAGNYQYGFLAHMRVDVHTAHPQSFCKLIGLTP